jgi:tetratricopeptide (TPR) repeat protein
MLLTEWRVAGSRLGEGLRRNWRLYGPLLLAGLAGALYVWRLISVAPSVGANLRDVTPLQYLYTSSRAIFTYLRLFLFPVGQNFDPDFRVSRSLMEQGAFPALGVLLVLSVAAVYFRSRLPLVCYGLLLFLVLLAPTSSVVPMADPLAERRMYLPFLGLLLVLAAVLAQWRVDRNTLALAMASVVLVAAVLTYRRSLIWSDDIVFWKDAVAKSPRKPRPYDHLVYSYVRANRGRDAVEELERAGSKLPRDYFLLMNWALTYERIQEPEKALSKLREAAGLKSTAEVYALMGRILARLGRRAEALDALETAVVKERPGSDMQHVYRGHLHAAAERIDAALAEYRRALQANPANTDARSALATLASRYGASSRGSLVGQP